MLKLSEVYEERKVTNRDGDTFSSYVIPFQLATATKDRFILDFSSRAKESIRRDGRKFSGSVGPNFAQEIYKAYNYATGLIDRADSKNAKRYSTRDGYVIRDDTT